MIKLKYTCGYGLCKDDFSIEEIELASFVNINDAYEFIKMKYFNDYSSDRIYYVDADQGREYYNKKTNEFTGEFKKIDISGYEITAGFEYDAREDYTEETEWDYEKNYSVTYKKAEEIQSFFYRNGAYIVDIEEEELNVYNHFWYDKFIKQNIENEMER